MQVPGAAPELLMEWAAEAEREFLKVQAADAAERRAAWRKWVLGAAKDRPGLLYRWVKGEAQAPKTATTVDGRWTLDPKEVVEGEAAFWGGLWAPEGGESWVARRPVLGLRLLGWTPPCFGKSPGG